MPDYKTFEFTCDCLSDEVQRVVVPSLILICGVDYPMIFTRRPSSNTFWTTTSMWETANVRDSIVAWFENNHMPTDSLRISRVVFPRATVRSFH